MKLASRGLVRLFALAGSVVCLPLATASANHRDHCKGDIEAEATVLGVGPGAVHEARHAAVIAWKHEVATKHGWDYARWSLAEDKKLRCDTHERKGTTECEAEADPCH